MREYQSLIGGEWKPARSGKPYCTSNPADTREGPVVIYEIGTSKDVNAAIEAASAAFPAWSALTPVARGRFLSKTSQILESRKAELSELLTREEGKTLAESQGEVQRAVDIFRFYGGLSYALGGQTIPHDLPGNLLFTRREPLGVVGLITPWNFPIAIPAWKLAPALVSGNTVVMKPATYAPAMTLEIAKALIEAGLPKGVLSVVVGLGREVGNALVSNPKIVAVSFTGSQEVGQQIYQILAGRMARAQMEMGGKNPTIVLADADLDFAASLVAKAGFGLTGQACTATSRVIVEKSVAASFTEKLVAKARVLKVGNGLTAGVEMGPAVSKTQLETDLNYVKAAVDEGAKLLCGGRQLNDGEFAHGYFIEPTVLGDVTPAMQIAREEVFGPVIAILAVSDFDEALQVANGVEAGLSASIVTRDLKKAMVYAERIQAGVVKINQISTGLALQAPFGGVKKSSTDTFREQGAGAIEFYTRQKTIYLDYSN